MATIVSFHAHPDDESIGTSGLLARAVDAGHQIGPDHYWVAMDPEAFTFVFGVEWFIVDLDPAGARSAVFDELFEPLAPAALT